MDDPDIERLDLAAKARAGAYALKAAHPAVVFTSGRRDIAGQARAMAHNVALNRRWIVETYRPTTASAACQAWVDAHPAAGATEIAAGLADVLTGLGAAASEISKHLTGEAFDVQPVTANAGAIIASIRALPGLDKFLEREGGLTIWHAQF